MAIKAFNFLKLLPAAFLILSAAVFAVALSNLDAASVDGEALACYDSALKKSAQQTKEFSPGWSEAEPWVSPVVDIPARFSGRQKFSSAQTTDSKNKRNARPDDPSATTQTTRAAHPAQFFYEFTQPQFYIRRIVIEHDEKGRGWITFERQNEETAIKEELELSAAATGRVLSLWQSLRFLDSAENYQARRQFPHLGTMRLRMEQDAHKRTAEFNWTNNKEAFALVNEYRRAADQAILVFDLSVARENQPLNSPKLMDQLETMLKRNALSDPQQLVPLLQDITGDEHLPLIARNHAARLLKQIEK